MTLTLRQLNCPHQLTNAQVLAEANRFIHGLDGKHPLDVGLLQEGERAHHIIGDVPGYSWRIGADPHLAILVRDGLDVARQINRKAYPDTKVGKWGAGPSTLLAGWDCGVVLDLADGLLAIVDAHFAPSVTRAVHNDADRAARAERRKLWDREAANIVAMLKPYPRAVAAGDFNAPPGYEGMKAFKVAGFTDHQPGITHPATKGRIDHAVTRGVGVVSQAVWPRLHSDHCPVETVLLVSVEPAPAPKPEPAPTPPKETTVPDFTVNRYGTDTSGRAIWMTAYMHDWWERVVAELGFTPTIVQGAFMVRDGGGAAASAGYHDAGGCIDVRIWDLTASQQTKLIRTVREMGAAAWRRGPKQGMDPHCHITLGSDRPLSSGAQASWTSYLRGDDGLASNGPDYEWRPAPLVTEPPSPEEDDMQLNDKVHPKASDSPTVGDVLWKLNKFVARQDARQKEALSRLDPDAIGTAVAAKLGGKSGLTEDQVKEAVKAAIREGVAE